MGEVLSPDQRVGHSPIRELASMPFLRRLLLSAFAVNFAQWAVVFTGAETLNRSGWSVLAVQLIAVPAFAPLLLGGSLAGRFAARIDRLTALRVTLVLLGLGVAVAAAALYLGAPTGVVYAVAFIAGFGQLGNLVLQRPLMFDSAGDRLSTPTFAADAVGVALAIALGPLVMGLVLSVGGAPVAFAVVAASYVAAWILVGVRVGGGVAPARPASQPTEAAEPRAPEEARSQLRDDVEVSREVLPVTRARAFSGVIVITVVVNFFFTPTLSVVPVIASQFTDRPWLAGVLAAGPGMGMVVTNTLLVVRRRIPLAAAFYLGAAAALGGTMLVSQVGSFVACFLVLFVAGCGLAGFSVGQTPLAMASAPPGQRVQAMGRVSQAIGVLPLGSLTTGAVFTAVGTTTGLTVVGLVGFSLVVLAWPLYRALRVVTDG